MVANTAAAALVHFFSFRVLLRTDVSWSTLTNATVVNGKSQPAVDLLE